MTQLSCQGKPTARGALEPLFRAAGRPLTGPEPDGREPDQAREHWPKLGLGTLSVNAGTADVQRILEQTRSDGSSGESQRLLRERRPEPFELVIVTVWRRPFTVTTILPETLYSLLRRRPV